MKKQILSLFFIVCFVLMSLPGYALPNNNDSVTVYAVSDKTTVVPGDTFTVTLKVNDLVVDGSTVSKGLQFRFDYDSDMLDISGTSNGSVLRQANTKMVKTSTAGQVGVMAVFSDKIDIENGELATLTFTVKSGAAGQIDFKLLNSQEAIATTFGSVPEMMVEGEILPALSVSAEKERVLREEEITYSFDLSKVTDFRGLEFDFDYDETKLQYVSSVEGEAFDEKLSGGINDTDGVVKVVFVYDSAMEFEGNVCTVTFKVKTTAQNGKIENEVKEIKTTAEIDDIVEVDAVEIYGENLSARLNVTANKNEVNRGEEIEYTFDLSETAAFNGLQFDFDYDETKLEYVSATEGDIFDNAFSGGINDEGGKVSVVVAYGSPEDYEGNVCKIVLRVKENAPAGSIKAVITGVKSTPTITVAEAEIVVSLKSQAILTVTPDKEGVTRESLITYSFDMTKVLDFNGIQFDFDYDETKLEYVSSTNGEVFDDSLNGGINEIDGTVRVIVVYDNKIEFEGNLCTLTFRVKDSAEAGELGAEVTGLVSVTDFSVNYADVAYVPDKSIVTVVADKSQANTGDVIVYTVSLSETLMYSGVEFTLDYDETQLTFAGFEEGDVFEDALSGGANEIEGEVKVVAVNQTPVDFAGGTICKLMFEVNSPENGAVYGETSISFTEFKAEFDVTEELDGAVVSIGSLLDVTANKETAIAGDDVVYSVDISPACDFDGMEFFFEYDADVFEHIENIPGEAFELDGSLGGMELFEPGKVKLVLAQDGKFEGNICKIVFRVKEGVPYGVVYNTITDLKAPCVLKMGNTSGSLEIVPSEEDKAAAAAVIELIEAIGEVTLESGNAIAAAEAALGALTDVQKTLVTNKDVLEVARGKYNTLVADKAAADAVIAKIEAIGEVTLESGEAIAAAEEALGALTDAQKALVTNKDVLTNARATFNSLRTVKFETYTSSVKVDSIVLKVGDKITEPTVSRKGYKFKGWYLDSGFDELWDFENGTVTDNMTLYAKWSSTSSGGGGGGGGGSKRGTSAGTPVVVAPSTPQQPEEDTKPETGFNDVEGHWAKEDISFLVEKNILTGVSETTFEPDRAITRAEMAAIVDRVLDLEDVTGMSFTDVSADEWYYNSVNAVSAKDIIIGYNDGSFRPNNLLVRQETATILLRIYKYLNIEGKPLQGISQFEDADTVASWAVDYVDAAVSNGIIGGFEDNTLRPLESTTRAQVARMIKRLFDMK